MGSNSSKPNPKLRVDQRKTIYVLELTIMDLTENDIYEMNSLWNESKIKIPDYKDMFIKFINEKKPYVIHELRKSRMSFEKMRKSDLKNSRLFENKPFNTNTKMIEVETTIEHISKMKKTKKCRFNVKFFVE